MSGWYSQPHSIAGISDAAFCWQYSSSLLLYGAVYWWMFITVEKHIRLVHCSLSVTMVVSVATVLCRGRWNVRWQTDATATPLSWHRHSHTRQTLAAHTTGKHRHCHTWRAWAAHTTGKHRHWHTWPALAAHTKGKHRHWHTWPTLAAHTKGKHRHWHTWLALAAHTKGKHRHCHTWLTLSCQCHCHTWPALAAQVTAWTQPPLPGEQWNGWGQVACCHVSGFWQVSVKQAPNMLLQITCQTMMDCLDSFTLETHTHTHLTAIFPGLPGWAGTRKVKPVWIFLKQETVSGSGISWAICKSAFSSR